MMFMYKLIFLFWQEGCAITLKLFSSTSGKQKGLRHQIAVARHVHGDKGKASELDLVKELEKLRLAGNYPSLFSGIMT